VCIPNKKHAVGRHRCFSEIKILAQKCEPKQGLQAAVNPLVQHLQEHIPFQG